MPQPRMVLTRTSHPGNIGASARAMKNMGLNRLSLVDPLQFPSAEATARASGADDLLAAVEQFASLGQAVADCVLVIGASARVRSLPVPLLNPRQCAEMISQQQNSHQVALVFGNERTGLNNTELDLCHYLVQIPTNPDYSSLNLAAAVQVLSYELRMATTDIGSVSASAQMAENQLASTAEVERFYEHLEATLIEIDFLNPAQPKQLMRRLRRLFGRSRLDQNEVNILRGILTAAVKAMASNQRQS
ncbi:MAG: RNA methyltransferase [Gammaproteobacteria bacterium]